METNLDATLRAAGENPDYDAACKRVLSEKIILAWIMKRCLKEYANCDVKAIAEKYIEGSPEVMQTPVAPDETNRKQHTIEGMNTEDSTITKGVVRYDIRFRAKTPKSDKIGLIINVEAQNKSDAKHSLMKRAIYYCARMISSQKKDIFENSKYDDIVKVYSIWLYMNPPKERRNSITRYSIKEESLIGNVKEIVENYDLMSVVNVWSRGLHN